MCVRAHAHVCVRACGHVCVKLKAQKRKEKGLVYMGETENCNGNSRLLLMFSSKNIEMINFNEFCVLDSSFIKQALEGEYPKLLRLHLDLYKRLQADPVTANIFPNV